MTLNTRSSQIAFATKSGPRCPLPAAMSHLPHGIARAEPARAAQFIVNAEPILSVEPPSAGESAFSPLQANGNYRARLKRPLGCPRDESSF